MDNNSVTKTARKPSKNGRKTGRFTPGNPGGPGRPQGSRNTASLVLDSLADGEAEAIFAQVVASARGGDMKAADMILSRAWPQRKGRPVAFSIPPVATPADVLTAHGAIMAAVGNGQITPEEATLVSALLDNKRKAMETVEIETRLAKLESKKP